MFLLWDRTSRCGACAHTGLSEHQTPLLQLYGGLWKQFPSKWISFPPSLPGFMCVVFLLLLFSGLKQSSPISILPFQADLSLHLWGKGSWSIRQVGQTLDHEELLRHQSLTLLSLTLHQSDFYFVFLMERFKPPYFTISLYFHHKWHNTEALFSLG